MSSYQVPPASGSPSEIQAAVLRAWRDVLGVPVQADDVFQALGGHSLHAVRILNRIRRDTGRGLQVKDFFRLETPAAIAQRLADFEEDEQRPSPVAFPEPAVAVASPGQVSLWFVFHAQEYSAAYHMFYAYRIRGALDRVRLQAALDSVTARHDALRTGFSQGRDGSPRPFVDAEARILLAWDDLAGVAETERDACRDTLLKEHARRPFDLGFPPLMRAGLVREREDTHVFWIQQQHIISDGWSVGLLLDDLADQYNAGGTKSGPMPPLTYGRYAAYQQAMTAHWEQSERLTWWIDYVKGAPDFLTLPTNRPRHAPVRNLGRRFRFTCAPATTEALHRFCRKEKLSPFCVTLAAFQRLITAFSGTRDFLLGFPFANRTHPELESLIGFVTDTLMVRTPSWHDDFLGYVRAVNDSLDGVFTHQDLPFEAFVRKINPTRHVGVNLMFQVMFAFQNTRIDPPDLEGAAVTGLPFDPGCAMFDLSLEIERTSPALSGYLEYDTDMFDEETAVRLIGLYEDLLVRALAQPRRPHPEDAEAVAALVAGLPADNRPTTHQTASINPAKGRKQTLDERREVLRQRRARHSDTQRRKLNERLRKK